MSVWTRWRIAFPLVGLSLLLLVPALFGAVTWWPDTSLLERTLTVAICVVLTASLAGAISIGVRPAHDVPWLRIGLVVLGLLLTCGLAVLRRSA